MLTVKDITLEDDISWDEVIKKGETATFFQTKEWLLLWVKHWGKNIKVSTYAIYDADELVGIAPFMISDKINILGVADPSESASLSDFGDVIIKMGREREVWEAVLKRIKNLQLELNYIREESPSFEILKNLGGKIEAMELSPIVNLPATWDEYLSTLDRHDRHEIRRKMRKAEEAGVVIWDYQADVSVIEDFFRLMIVGNEQKRNFLSGEMKEFFRDLINTFGQKQMLDLKFLKYEGKIIAATLSFIFGGEVLLYNSGFDATYNNLSPGLLLKVNLIKRAIENGKKRFDFLRGGERYKYDLGGRERKLYRITFY